MSKAHSDTADKGVLVVICLKKIVVSKQKMNDRAKVLT